MADGDGFDVKKIARQVAAGAFQGIWDWLTKPKRAAGNSEPSRSVLIIGPGGVGKTTLARVLAGEAVWLDDDTKKYEESFNLEHFALADDPETELVVAPGQDFRRPNDWPALKSQLAASEYRGVILVSAYGYHNFRAPSYKNHELYAKLKSKSQFWDAYRVERRADELRVLRELLPHLVVCPDPLWLLSLVTKQDLWAGEQPAVEEHYLRSEYATAIAEVAAARGPRFRHETAFVSLTVRNLRTQQGEPLADTVAGYDAPRHVATVATLIQALAALRAWEGVS